LYLNLARWVTDTNYKESDQIVHDRIFGPDVISDWLVSLGSQQGDSETSERIWVSWHCTETSDADFEALVINWLNESAQPTQTRESLVEERNITIESKKQHATLLGGNTLFEKTVIQNAVEASGTVEIIAPTQGQNFTAGQSITISIQGTGDTSQGALFALFGTSSWADIVELPWTGDVNVPSDSVGSTAKIYAIGLDADMNMTDEAEVNLILESDIELEEIFFGFGDKWYFDFTTDPCQSHKLQLYPMGSFSDGSEHPLSVLSDQTTYQSLDESVATVDANGLITVHQRGIAPILVTNSSKSATLVVEVDTYLGDLNLDGVVDFRDFAILALAWMSQSGQTNWNPACDISEPKDNIVDWNDLSVFTEDWLEGL
jgi:hypothetical protein